MLEELGDKVSDTVAINLENVSQDQREIIRYTVVQLVGELIKMIIMAGIAIYFHVGWLLFIAIFSMSLFRIPAGGVHSKSHISCFVTSSAIFFGNIVLSINACGDYLDYIYLLILLFNIVIIHIFAPADTEMKPIVSKKLRLKLKIVSYIGMFTLVFAGRFIITDITIRNIFIFGTLFQSITMLPFMYKLIGTKYGFRDGITEPQI